jgi:hypothetical protein
VIGTSKRPCLLLAGGDGAWLAYRGTSRYQS